MTSRVDNNSVRAKGPAFTPKDGPERRYSGSKESLSRMEKGMELCIITNNPNHPHKRRFEIIVCSSVREESFGSYYAAIHQGSRCPSSAACRL